MMKPEELSSFKQWLQERGFHLSPHLDIAYFPDTGWGVITSIPMEEGDKILDLSQNLLVTPHRVSDSLSLLPFKGNLSSFHLLVVWLMIEKCLGTTSDWFPYIRLLPSTFTTPSYCPSSFLAAFTPLIRSGMVSQRRRIKTEYEQLKSHLLQLEPLYAVKKDSLTNFRLFRWAWTCVNTRCVSMPNHQMALAPLLDFLNHNAQSQVSRGNGYDAESKCYQVFSAGRVAANSQVFITYGLHSNSTLAMEYGFLSPGNPHSNLYFSLDELISCSPKQVKQEVMHRIISQRLHLDLCVDWNGPSWCFTEIVQLLAIESAQKKLLNRIVQNRLKEIEQTKRLKHKSSRYHYFLEMASVLLLEEMELLNTILSNDELKV